MTNGNTDMKRTLTGAVRGWKHSAGLWWAAVVWFSLGQMLGNLLVFLVVGNVMDTSSITTSITTSSSLLSTPGGVGTFNGGAAEAFPFGYGFGFGYGYGGHLPENEKELEEHKKRLKKELLRIATGIIELCDTKKNPVEVMRMAEDVAFSAGAPSLPKFLEALRVLQERLTVKEDYYVKCKERSCRELIQWFKRMGHVAEHLVKDHVGASTMMSKDQRGFGQPKTLQQAAHLEEDKILKLELLKDVIVDNVHISDKKGGERMVELKKNVHAKIVEWKSGDCKAKRVCHALWCVLLFVLLISWLKGVGFFAYIEAPLKRWSTLAFGKRGTQIICAVLWNIRLDCEAIGGWAWANWCAFWMGFLDFDWEFSRGTSSHLSSFERARNRMVRMAKQKGVPQTQINKAKANWNRRWAAENGAATTMASNAIAAGESQYLYDANAALSDMESGGSAMNSYASWQTAGASPPNSPPMGSQPPASPMGPMGPMGGSPPVTRMGSGVMMAGSSPASHAGSPMGSPMGSAMGSPVASPAGSSLMGTPRASPGLVHRAGTSPNLNDTSSYLSSKKPTNTDNPHNGNPTAAFRRVDYPAAGYHSGLHGTGMRTMTHRQPTSQQAYYNQQG